MKLSISRRTSMLDHSPRHETMSWLDFTALLSEPYQAPCTRQTCLGSNCPYKRGPCWSPAALTWTGSSLQVARIAALVFDVDRLTNDQIDEIRGGIGRLQYLMHSTHSDSLDSRYLRIVIALSQPVSPDMWGPFFHTALRNLVPGADAACADPQRFYFLPSCPRDAPFFIQVNKGLPLDVGALLTTIPYSQIAASST